MHLGIQEANLLLIALVENGVIPRAGSVFLTGEEARLLYGRKMGVGCEERRGWVRKRVGGERGSNWLFFFFF